MAHNQPAARAALATAQSAAAAPSREIGWLAGAGRPSTAICRAPPWRPTRRRVRSRTFPAGATPGGSAWLDAPPAAGMKRMRNFPTRTRLLASTSTYEYRHDCIHRSKTSVPYRAIVFTCLERVMCAHTDRQTGGGVRRVVGAAAGAGTVVLLPRVRAPVRPADGLVLRTLMG